MTDGISAYAGTISAYAATRRQEQNRSAQARWRMRRRLRLVTRQITLEPEWLDALEVRGYLDPFDRTLAKAEIAAVRKFMGEHSGQKQSNDRPPHHQTIATALIRRCSSWWSIASKGRKEGGIAAGPRAGRVPAPARGRKRLPVVGFAAEERVRPFKGQRGSAFRSGRLEQARLAVMPRCAGRQSLSLRLRRFRASTANPRGNSVIARMALDRSR
jgi:hypothetical protein